MKKHLLTLTSCLLLSSAVQAEIRFSKNISKDNIQALSNDIKSLDDLSLLGQTSRAFQKFFNSKTVSGDVFTSWLESRVQFVVEETFTKTLKLTPLEPMVASAKDKSSVAQSASVTKFDLETKVKGFIGRNLSDPETFKDMGLHTDGDNGGVVMSNLGTAIYYLGKKNSVVIGVDIELADETIQVPMTSPRSGIIQIGPVLFSKRYLINTEDIQAKVNSYNRMGTFLHEARHSDGSEEHSSLGFFHQNCPSFHALKGLPACDYNGNGPYTIGGVFMYETATKCTDDCLEEEKAGLLARAYDSFSRVMKVNNKLRVLNDSPEGQRVENR
jgi:hypothetical protein